MNQKYSSFVYAVKGILSLSARTLAENGKPQKRKATYMAHHITGNMISFNGETPWHGLGTRVSAGATPEEMLKAAKMDWEVQLRSLAVSCTKEDGTNGWCHQPMREFKAVMRADTNEVFAVPTARYKAVQNREIAEFFREYCDAASCELQVVGALDGGRKVWALAKVNADYVISTDGQTKDRADEQLGYVMIATSHDGSLRTIAMGTAIYVACWNTMSAALGRMGEKLGKTNVDKAFFSLKHTARFDHAAKQQAARTVGLVKEQLEATATLADKMARVELDEKGRVEFVRRLIGGSELLEQIVAEQEKRSLLDTIVLDHVKQEAKMPEETRLGRSLLEEILNSPGAELPTRKGTMWGAINGVTHFADFNRGRTQDSTLNQAWFGQGATLKENAVRVAVEMSGVRVQ